MEEQLLSKDELDALLQSVDEGSQGENNTGSSEVYSYDLTNQEKVVRGRMPELERINERFSKFLRESIAGIARRRVDIALTGIQTQKYGEYSHALHLPVALTLVRFNPFKGVGLISIDSNIVFRLVDLYFGGPGVSPEKSVSDFTFAEKNIITKLINAILPGITEAWSEVTVCEPELLRVESNPSMAVIAELSETVVVSGFHVEIDGVGGDFHIVMPYSMLEPMQDVLEGIGSASQDSLDQSWVNALTNSVLTADVDINCMVAEKMVTLRDIIDLKPGDVIPVDIDEKLVMTANRTPVFHVSMGVVKGNLALQVSEKIDNQK